MRDIAAGEVVGADDVTVTARPRSQRPETALSSPAGAVGRIAAGALAAREVVTPERLVGSGILSGQPSDHVALTVPVLDVASVGVRAGSRIDLFATGTGQRAASDVVVLGVRDAVQSSRLGTSAPPQVTLALSPSAASDVARSLGALDAGQVFVIALRQPPVERPNLAP
jgi:Flp pilus assembly protein CpaB